MAYKQRVLSDLPVAYWRLNERDPLRYDNNTTLYTDENVVYDQNILNVLQDAYGDKDALILHGSFPNLLNVSPIVPASSTEKYFNGCRINSNTNISIHNQFNVFEKGYEDKTFAIEFWTLLENNIKDKITFLLLKNDANEKILEIYAIQDSIYFSVYGINSFLSTSSSFTTKKQLTSFDEKIHVFAVYSNKTIKIMINGMLQETISFDSGFSFLTNFAQVSNFSIEPAPTGFSYVISDLAFYDRELSLNEIRSHMFWASKDSDPLYQVQQGSAYNFNINNQKDMLISSKSFQSKNDYDQGFYSDIISDGPGLTIQQTAQGSTVTGSWLYNFPITQFENFAGIDISWDTASPEITTASSRSVCVYSSYDNGATFYNIKNNKVVPFFLSTASTVESSQLLIKVEIHSEDTSLALQPRIDNLSVNLYKSIDLTADSGGFKISPFSSQTYMVKNKDRPFILKGRNLGINFASQNPGVSNPGKAVITSPNLISYQSIEFWFKYNGSGAAVVDASDSPLVDVYIDSANNTIKNNLAGGKLYVNALNITSTDLVLSVGETYHVIVVLPTSTTNPVYINGDANNAYIPCDASYGFITLYPSTLTASKIFNRYLSYLSVNTSIFYDSVTSLGSLVEYSGTSSQINGGLSVIASEHTL